MALELIALDESVLVVILLSGHAGGSYLTWPVLAALGQLIMELSECWVWFLIGLALAGVTLSGQFTIRFK